MKENYKLFTSLKSNRPVKKVTQGYHPIIVPENSKFFPFSISGKITFLAFLLLLTVSKLSAQTNDDCLTCHDDPSLTKERAGKKVSLYIKPTALDHSVHKNVLCASCHTDAAVAEFPHPENLKPVNCGTCHEDARDKYFRGIHGRAFLANEKFAPTCKECHGMHDILKSDQPESRTYKMNIPVLCGSCHKEGAPVARAYNISEHNILENYSEGIHGQGLYKKGLIVSATCNNCHGNHLILPHTNFPTRRSKVWTRT
jgi:hypothetical protein